MKQNEDADFDRKLFLLYVLLHLFFLLLAGVQWWRGESEEFVTPKGQEVVEKQPESGPFQ